MCEPTTIAIAGLAISAVSAVAGQEAQRSSVNKQQDALYAQSVDDANTRGIQMNQVSEAAAQQANERNLAARQEAASFAAVSGEYGGGVSSQRGIGVTAFNQSNDLSLIDANRNRNLTQLGREGGAANLKYQAQLASLNQPSTLGTGLQIAGAATNAYATYDANKTAQAARVAKLTTPK